MIYVLYVYIFKNLYFDLIKNGHEILVLASNKEMTCQLLDKFGITYKLMGRNQKRIIGKLVQVIKYSFITFFQAIQFKADLFLGFGYIHFAAVSFILNKPFLFPDDTEVAKNVPKLLMPFTSSFITTSGFKNRLSKKQIWFNGNLELSYLHPNRYENKLKNLKEDNYVLIRFVSWEAFHDIGHNGISLTAKRKLVQELSKTHKIYIASEGQLSNEFEKFQLNIPVDKIHEFVSGADLVIGESPTMTTEAAMLGTPAICISSWACEALGNFEELSKLDLIYCFKPQREDDSIKKAIELLKTKGLKEIWKKKSIEFINSRIDVTSFLVWFIENYPNSHQIMKDNPDYQKRFK